jgi:hypothetical protein
MKQKPKVDSQRIKSKASNKAYCLRKTPLLQVGFEVSLKKARMSLKKACGQSMALESDDPESSDLMHP